MIPGCMAWRAIPGPLSKRKWRLDSLEAAQGAPRDPRRDSRGERSPWLPLETPSKPPGKPKNTGVGSLPLVQEIVLTQGSNWGLMHCRWILYQLSYQGSLSINLLTFNSLPLTPSLLIRNQPEPGERPLVGSPAEVSPPAQEPDVRGEVPRHFLRQFSALDRMPQWVF